MLPRNFLKLFIASYFKQLLADIKIYNGKTKTSFLDAESMGSKLVFILRLYIFIYVENWIQYNARHYFSVWLRTASNPPDINWF